MRTLVAWVRDNIALLHRTENAAKRRLAALVPDVVAAPRGHRPLRSPAPRLAGRHHTLPAATGLVVYFEHVDLQLATLCGDNGPFSGCLGRHNPAGPAHASASSNPTRPTTRGEAATASGLAPPPPAAAPPPATAGGRPRRIRTLRPEAAMPAPVPVQARVPHPNGMHRNGHGPPPQRR